MKIVTILGTRPQFIKASSVSRAISKYDEIEKMIVHTGQHFDANMSDVFIEEMQIPRPDYNLSADLYGAGMASQRIIQILLKG